MAAPLSQDLRRRLVQAVEAGSSAREAARRFAVSESAAIKLVRRVGETGSTAPARIGGYRKPLLAGHEALLRELVAAKGTITLAEIKARLAERGIEAGCLTTIWSTLRRLDLSHKKNSLRAAEQDRADVAEHRRMWRVWQRYMDPERFMFIDGRVQAPLVRAQHPTVPRPTWSGAMVGLRAANAWSRPRRTGGAAQGSACLQVEWLRRDWRTTTFVAGLRSTGLVAPLVLDGPMNGPAFLAYVEQFLAPALRPGDVVVMDNLSPSGAFPTASPPEP